MQINLLLLFATLVSISCTDLKGNLIPDTRDGAASGSEEDVENNGPPLNNVPTNTIAYTESFEDFPNPERGFYRYSATTTSNYSPLSENTVRGYRSTHTPSGSLFSINSTLLYRYFVIDDTKDQALSAQTLQHIHADMNTVRAAGAKVIPRFVYTTTQNGANQGRVCPEGFICPPYGDAPKNIVLQHIDQLKPIFEEHEDIIAVVQMGFIGTWGEQYYTDYFGDPSQNGGQGKLLDANWTDRNEIVEALLDAVPNSRMIQVRYPQLKQRFLLGVNAPYTSTGMTLSDAYTGSDIARIGIHNDCFLSSSNDVGTYVDYGNSSTPRASGSAVVTALRAYASNEGTYTPVGGETCRKDPTYPDCNCNTVSGGRAVEEMELMRYSYLNVSYNQALNNDWETQGCAEEIKLRLGYRFVLKDAQLPTTAQAGTTVPFALNVENVGFASPFNARPVKVILRNTSTNETTDITLQTDVRKWFPGSVTVAEDILIPTELAAGTYEMLLSLHDASATIADRVEYAVRLANENTWEASTGLNKLNSEIAIY